MPEPETEEQTVERIEAALRKIAALAQKPTSGGTSGGGIDRAALATSLDLIINRLRGGLAPRAAGETE